MTRRIRIPFIIDVLLVDDPSLMSTLNDHPLISRRLVRSNRLVNEFTRRKIQGQLRVGEVLLPVFQAREDTEGRRRQRQLGQRLDALAEAGLPAHADDIARLGAFVAGAGDVNIGVVVQRIVGRLFRADYVATEASYRAACTIDAWPRANPVATLWLRWSGGLRRARGLIWASGRGDTQCIHGTAIAMHNIVATLRNMKAGAARGELTADATPAEAVDKYLQAPATLIRSCTGETVVDGLRGRLHRGTLVVLQLGKAPRDAAEPNRAFAQGQWNECPATQATRKLLELTWDRARSLKGADRPEGAEWTGA